jgi:sulfur carrier protein ThiS
LIITVHFHTILQRHTPQGAVRELDIEIPDGSSVGDLLRALEIELSPDALLLVVNGRLVEEQNILQPGDRVNLMPALSGG